MEECSERLKANEEKVFEAKGIITMILHRKELVKEKSRGRKGPGKLWKGP